VESGREDTRKDSNEMETGDEVEEMTHNISCEGTPTHQQRENIKKRDYTHNIQHASILPPLKLSPKRPKKLKTDRDFPLRGTDQEAEIDTKINTRRFPPTTQYTPTTTTTTTPPSPHRNGLHV